MRLTYRQPDKPIPPRAPRAATPIGVTLVLYWIGGVLGGAASGATVGAIEVADHRGWIPLTKEDDRWQMAQFREPPFPGCIESGAVIGPICSSFLWIIACLWRSARHPITAAVLCASLGGSLVLILFVTTNANANLPRDEVGTQLLILACVLAIGAIFGLVTTLAVRLLEFCYTAFDPSSAKQ